VGSAIRGILLSNMRGNAIRSGRWQTALIQSTTGRETLLLNWRHGKAFEGLLNRYFGK